MEPLHESLVSKFEKLSPYILKYAEVVKPIPFQEITEKFGQGLRLSSSYLLNFFFFLNSVLLSLGPVSALVLLPKLLNFVMNKNTVSQAHADHIKNYKSTLDGVPSSALVQIVPVS